MNSTLSKFHTSDTWKGLTENLPPIHELIKNSDTVYFLGGTFKTLTDDERNILAMKELLDKGIKVRILIQDPTGEGLRMRAEERQEKGQTITRKDLSMEVVRSIIRIADRIGPDILPDIMKAYGGLIHNSYYRLGNLYVLTIYTFGRGGSSPSFSVMRDEDTMKFCDKLDTGFDDLWNAPSTKPVTNQWLKQE